MVLVLEDVMGAEDTAAAAIVGTWTILGDTVTVQRFCMVRYQCIDINNLVESTTAMERVNRIALFEGSIEEALRLRFCVIPTSLLVSSYC
jgi:hypothetical protein